MSMIGRTSPTSEPGTARYLAVHQGWRNVSRFAQLVACVVRESDPANEWDGPDATGYRNTIWSSNKATALYVSDLEITCQFDLPEAEHTYGNLYTFYCHGSVDAKEAKAMAKTYDRLEAAHERLSTNEGHVARGDYAHWLLRNGAILGVGGFLFPALLNARDRTLRDVSQWTLVTRRDQVYEQVKIMLDWYKGKLSA